MSPALMPSITSWGAMPGRKEMEEIKERDFEGFLHQRKYQYQTKILEHRSERVE